MTPRHYVHRLIEFSELPQSLRALMQIPECRAAAWRTVAHLWTLFFRYKQSFASYQQCRLWEVPRSRWKFYYGSNYNSYQRYALAREVQPSQYRMVFKNKALCAIVCRGIGVRIPATYGTIAPEEPYRDRLESWCRTSPARSLIIKPVEGSGGQGVSLVQECNGTIRVKSGDDSSDLAHYTLRHHAIVQEAVAQDPRLAAFAPASVNTIRVVTLMPKCGDSMIISAFIRFGVGHACVDNFSAGGVACAVHTLTGELRPPASDRWNRLHVCHPTSGRALGGFVVPNWPGIVAFALKIQGAFDFYRLLGLDIALGADGEPILIEINPAPDLDGLEAGPLLADPRVLKAFGDYNLLVNRLQRKLYQDLLTSVPG